MVPLGQTVCQLGQGMVPVRHLLGPAGDSLFPGLQPFQFRQFFGQSFLFRRQICQGLLRPRLGQTALLQLSRRLVPGTAQSLPGLVGGQLLLPGRDFLSQLRQPCLLFLGLGPGCPVLFRSNGSLCQSLLSLMILLPEPLRGLRLTDLAIQSFPLLL